jgi:hypothetical protein
MAFFMAHSHATSFASAMATIVSSHSSLAALYRMYETGAGYRRARLYGDYETGRKERQRDKQS